MKTLAGPLLVATDLEAGGDEAVRQAAALARAWGGAPLHICHVLPNLLGTRPLFPHLKQADAQAAQAFEGRVSDEIGRRTEALSGLPAGSFRVSVAFGSPHAMVVEEAERIGAGLIVVGGAREGAARFLASGTAELIVRYAHCPVLMARAAAGGSVLAATDLSEPSLPAVAAAAQEADRLQAPLVVLHVLEILPLSAAEFGFAAPFPAPSQVEAWREQARGELRAGLAGLGLDLDGQLLEGHPASLIVETARRLPARLVVVGTRGRTGLSRLALGSVAEGVLRSAPCSVLVVRLSGS